MAKITPVTNRLRQLNIPPESELGIMLTGLDNKYELLKTKKQQVRRLVKEIKQVDDDIEFMEMMIMYKTNKHGRGMQ